MFISAKHESQEDWITRWLLSKHEFPINDTLRLCEGGKIHLRMHASKLIHDILEPLAISIDNIVVEFLLCLLEELDLLSEPPLPPAPTGLPVGWPSPPVWSFGPASPRPSPPDQPPCCAEARSSLPIGRPPGTSQREVFWPPSRIDKDSPAPHTWRFRS